MIWRCLDKCKMRNPENIKMRGVLKMKIQAMCWVTSSKVAISNVKYISSRIIALAHPTRVPTTTPIYRGKCAHGQLFQFLNSTSNHIIWPLIWKLMLHWLYTPWKLLQHFKCQVKNNSRKENYTIAFRLQTRLSLKLLNSSENGICFNTLDESFKRNWAAQF